MQNALNKQELDMLQMRIEASPKEARAGLEAQLEALRRALEQSTPPRSYSKADRDAEIEALFDNMPV